MKQKRYALEQVLARRKPPQIQTFVAQMEHYRRMVKRGARNAWSLGQQWGCSLLSFLSLYTR